jgi:hypothetical protein
MEDYITSDALNYWQDELGNRSESTINLYLSHLEKLLNYLGKTADETAKANQTKRLA